MNRFVVIFWILYMMAHCNGYNQILDIENPEQYQEQAYIHYNSNFLMSGERLYYKLYIQNKSSSQATKLSKIGRVILIDRNNEQVFNHVLNLENGSAYSDFLIPANIQTGTYKLIGYSRWMENYDNEGIFESDIQILNPFSAKIDFKRAPVQVEDILQYNNRQLRADIELLLSQEKFAPRTKGMLTIKGIDIGNLDHLSVSIRKKDDARFGVPQKFNLSRKVGNINFSYKHPPEYRGRTFSGKIVDSSGNQISDRFKIFYSVHGKTNQFRVFQSEKDGSFNFQIPDPIDYSEVYLTAVNAKTNNYFVKVDTLNMKINGGTESFDFSILNPETLREKAIHIQIENYYKTVKQDSIIPFNTKPIFYGDNARIYNLDDYTRFETMDETFIEIIQFVTFRSKRTSPEVVIQGYSSQNIGGGIPLVLLDGQPIKDHATIFHLNPKTIREIRVVRDKYYYGPSFYQGILDIRSKNSTNKILSEKDRFQIQPTEPQKLYFQPDFENQDNIHVPDFRYQLLWNPELKTNQIQFFTSDVPGIYNVQIVGFDKNGKYIFLNKGFEVLD